MFEFLKKIKEYDALKESYDEVSLCNSALTKTVDRHKTDFRNLMHSYKSLETKHEKNKIESLKLINDCTELRGKNEVLMARMDTIIINSKYLIEAIDGAKLDGEDL